MEMPRVRIHNYQFLKTKSENAVMKDKLTLKVIHSDLDSLILYAI